MITQIDEKQHPKTPMQTWQTQWSEAFTQLETLLKYLDLNTSDLFKNDTGSNTSLNECLAATQDFPIKVPKAFADKIQKGNINDPLLRQVLPQPEEMICAPGYKADALNEIAQSPYKSFIHKYYGRILLIMTGACPVHCRYCFRRHFPYNDFQPTRQSWQEASLYLSKHPEIHELILSGGDPLSYKTQALYSINHLLNDNPQITQLRIHTRFPVILPSRIDSSFMEWVESIPIPIVIVVHCNHPNEIDSNFTDAMQTLKTAGVYLLNQSVLLKGINDSADTLINLSKKLFSSHVLPYYLHQLDKTLSTHHFSVDFEQALELAQNMSAKLPGYLVPKLAKEVPGFTSKVVQGPHDINSLSIQKIPILNPP